MENGKAAIARNLTNGRGFGSTEFHVLTPESVVSSEWIFYFVRQEHFRQRAKDNFTGAVGQQRVPADFLKSYPIPLPPRAEQDRIVARIAALLAESATARTALDAAPAGLARARQAALSAAFRGELVLPTPGTEPASKILARVTSTRRTAWEARRRASGKDLARTPYAAPAPPDVTDLPHLPDGWIWTTVEMLAKDEPSALTDGPFGSDLKTADYVQSGARVIRLQNVGAGEFKDQQKAFVSHEKFQTLRKHEAHAGDVIISALADPVGRACLVPPGLGDTIVKADCVRLRIDDQLADNRYVMLALNTPDHYKRAKEASHGIGRERVNLGDIKAFVIPLAPLEDQRRIVARLTALFAEAETAAAAVTAAARARARLDRQVLALAFRGVLVPQDPRDEPAAALLARLRAARAAAPARPAGRGPRPAASPAPSAQRRPRPAPPDQLAGPLVQTALPLDG